MDALLTAKDVKNLLNCSLPLVYKMADRGQIPCIRWTCPGEEGKREKTVVRFQKNDLMAFIEANKRLG